MTGTDGHTGGQEGSSRSFVDRLFEDFDAALAAADSDSAALDFLDACRWPDGVTCPECKSGEVYVNGSVGGISSRRRRCSNCGAQFTALSGTELHGFKQRPAILTLAIALSSAYSGLDLSRELRRGARLSKSSADHIALLVLGLRAAPTTEDSGRRALRRLGARAADPEREGASRAWVPAALVAALFGLITAAWVVWLQSKEPLEAVWFHQGEKVVYRTEREPGESRMDWVARHERRVNGMKQQATPDQK
ncbi:MAG: transposase [Planctomycetota bacterium]